MGESGRRTGRRHTLDADQIVAADRAVGVADFTMPAVASRLGVSHSTLYRYQRDLGKIESLGAAMPDEIWHGRGWFDEKLAIFMDGFALRRQA